MAADPSFNPTSIHGCAPPPPSIPTLHTPDAEHEENGDAHNDAHDAKQLCCLHEADLEGGGGGEGEQGDGKE